MMYRKHCKQCNDDIVGHYEVSGTLFYRCKAGHVSGQRPPSKRDFENFVSIDGKKPYKFQIDGAVFALNSPGRVGILDEMGLGKTVQALMVAHYLDDKFLVVAKSSLSIQWARECYRWLGKSLVQIINSETEFIMPGARGY